ncbi:MAG: hypothetical protein B6242_06330 [Anaerolineaceae bacterium 4572_78]|nr:MAG: hypothetical protein B6242_06330 [Anaerolineaceae bacterium 4572_78]
MLKKFIMPLFILLLMFILSGCDAVNEYIGEVVTPTPTLIPVVTSQTNAVSAEAYIHPLKTVDVVFEMPGRIVEMFVQEGDFVKKGDVVARLDDGDIQIAIAQAEAALARTESELVAAKLGALPEQIAQAEAGITVAEAGLARLLAGAKSEDIAMAQSRVNTLQAALGQVSMASHPQSIEAAAADIIQAKVAFAEAQTEYDKSVLAQNEEVYRIKLESAQSIVTLAQANFDMLRNGTTSEEIAIAQARIDEGLASLQRAKTGAMPEQIAEAQIAVQIAEAGLMKLLVGPRPEKIAVREAYVEQAKLTVEQAKKALDNTVLIAPSDGTVAYLNVEVSEYAQPGVPIMVLADFSEWLIKTDDLTEFDVINVTPGQAVELEIDAITDEIFNGKVKRIRSQSERKAGDVTYTVEIELDDNVGEKAELLRWGMTVNVDILLDEK